MSDESKWSKCVGGQGTASDSAVELTATPGHLAGLSGEGRRLENNGGPVKRGEERRGKEREIILFATALQAYRKGYRPI